MAEIGADVGAAVTAFGDALAGRNGGRLAREGDSVSLIVRPPPGFRWATGRGDR